MTGHNIHVADSVKMAQSGPTVLQFLAELNVDDKLQLDERAVQHYARVLNEQWFNFASELQSMDSQVPCRPRFLLLIV